MITSATPGAGRPRKDTAGEPERLRPRSDAGFTLIELLVVVIIIGILAAIAVPVYLGVQNNAKDVAVKSDLTNSRIALQNYVTATDGGWPLISATDGVGNRSVLGAYGWTGSAVVDDSAAHGGSPTAYCLQETSGSGAAYYLTESVAPSASKPAGCA